MHIPKTGSSSFCKTKKKTMPTDYKTYSKALHFLIQVLNGILEMLSDTPLVEIVVADFEKGRLSGSFLCY